MKIRIFTQGLLAFDVVGENADSIFYAGSGYGRRGLSKADKGVTWDYIPEQIDMFEDTPDAPGVVSVEPQTVEEVMDMANEDVIVLGPPDVEATDKDTEELVELVEDSQNSQEGTNES